MKYWKKILIRLAVLFFIAVLVLASTVFFIYRSYSTDLPDVKDIPDPVQSSKIYSDDGSLIAEIFTQRRTVVKAREIPETIIDAVIAIEDQRFYSHHGIDPLAVVRAFLKNIREGGIAEGASTITMQTAKNIFLTHFKSMDRKIKEAILALRLERAYSKSDIITIYLNNIYFGMGSYGIYEAAKTYFSKSLDSLTLEECALLAALPKAPYTYNPFRNMDLAKKRRDLVLKRMYDMKYIDFDRYYSAVSTPVRLTGEAREYSGSYFVDFVRASLIETVGEKNLYEGGLRINTTISMDFQKKAEEAVRRGLVSYQRRKPFNKENVIYREEKSYITDMPEYLAAEIKQVKKDKLTLLIKESGKTALIDVRSSGFKDIKNFAEHFEAGEYILISPPADNGYSILMPVPDAQASLVAINLEDNSIKAMVGGFSYRESQFNRAVQAKRQPGSAFKPFVFLSALVMGYGPLDSTYDLPLLVTEYRPGRGDGPADGWNPSNFDGRYLGSIPFSRALFESRNTVAVRLAQEITTTPIKYLARLAGINSPITTQLSMSLGSASISLLELSHAYTVFPNLGRLLPVRYITEICDKNNEIADISSPFPRDVVLPQYAYTMVRLLTGVADFGTGIRSRKADFEKAGKTGTSNDFRDNWFIGFTPDILVGVWIGKDNFESLGRNFTGGDTACPIFTDFLTSLDLKSNSFFSAPNGVYTCPLDLTGLSDCSPGEDTSYQVFPEPGLFIESIEMLDEGEDMISF